jgi:hypothetical protein
MKQWLCVVIGLVIITSLSSWAINRYVQSCAISKSTPMGTMIEPGAANLNLEWDQSCASGMRWMK